MAKRKLSEKDRASLRRMLKRGVTKQTPQSELLKSVAKKYGLSTETVRWYLKSLSNDKAGKRKAAKAARRGAASRGAKRQVIRRKRRKRRANRKGQTSAPALVRKSGVPALIKKAQAAARDRAREAATLKRLLPEYTQTRRSQEKLRDRLQEVRQLERAVSGSLRQADKRAKKLEAQLRGLI